ncbi:MAG: hypothetical protein AAFW89_01175 [Bacteroidota bacterium]
MRKLLPSERLILERLLFPESFEVIQEETSLNEGLIRDDIINLMNYRLIEALPLDDETDGSSFYDADRLKEYRFRITKKGLKHLRMIS